MIEIAYRPIRRPDDYPFIIGSYMKYARRNVRFDVVPNPELFPWAKAMVQLVLQHADFVIACSADDSAVLLGWAAFCRKLDGEISDWSEAPVACYVVQPLRKRGVFKAMKETADETKVNNAA